MKKLFLISVFVATHTVISAISLPDSIARIPLNNINLNILGDASIASINYERLFLLSPKFFISGDIGIGFNKEFVFGLDNNNPKSDSYLTIPGRITGNIGNRKHSLELGIGATKINGFPDKDYFIYPIIGYRMQPLKQGKVNFRIFATLLHNGDRTEIYVLPLGVSLGICF